MSKFSVKDDFTVKGQRAPEIISKLALTKNTYIKDKPQVLKKEQREKYDSSFNNSYIGSRTVKAHLNRSSVNNTKMENKSIQNHDSSINMDSLNITDININEQYHPHVELKGQPDDYIFEEVQPAQPKPDYLMLIQENK